MPRRLIQPPNLRFSSQEHDYGGLVECDRRVANAGVWGEDHVRRRYHGKCVSNAFGTDRLHASLLRNRSRALALVWRAEHEDLYPRKLTTNARHDVHESL